MGHIWVGSPGDVRYNEAAIAANQQRNDKKYWTDEEGIVKVDRVRWEEAQKFEHDGWISHWRDHQADRPMDHYKLFDGYAAVPNDIGMVVEFGCGPFTQVKHIVEFGNRNFSSATLIDPLIDAYPSMPHCTYKDKFLLRRPVELIKSQAEEFVRPNFYDTVICINVLEHVQDAWVVLNNLHSTLKTGGLIILGERTYDDFDCSVLFDIGHPIRIKSSVTNKFRDRFDVLFGSIGYFIGRKK